MPLTSSLYVPGRLIDVENVLIDVGTGYYAQKVRPRLPLRWKLCTLCATDAGPGGEALRRKDRLHQDESGRTAGDDPEETGQHVLPDQCNPVKAPIPPRVGQ